MCALTMLRSIAESWPQQSQCMEPYSLWPTSCAKLKMSVTTADGLLPCAQHRHVGVLQGELSRVSQQATVGYCSWCPVWAEKHASFCFSNHIHQPFWFCLAPHLDAVPAEVAKHHGSEACGMGQRMWLTTSCIQMRASSACVQLEASLLGPAILDTDDVPHSL